MAAGIISFCPSMKGGFNNPPNAAAEVIAIHAC